MSLEGGAAPEPIGPKVATAAAPHPDPAPASGIGPRIAGRVLPPLLFSVAVLVVWQMIAVLGDLSSTILPKPGEVADRLYQERDLLFTNGIVTAKEVLLGFLLALCLGLSLGVLISSSRWAKRAVYPWMIASQTVPIPAVAPLIVIWFGFGINSKIVVVALIAFFPLAVNTIDGLSAPPREMVDLMRSFGASRLRIFRTVYVPASLPFIFSGAKVAITLSTIGAVFGEWVGASEGLGYLILTFNNQSETADVFAAIFVLSVLGITLFGLVATCERLLLPWHHNRRAGGD